jgi:CBS domain-containing protein
MAMPLGDEMNRDVTLIHPNRSVKYAGQILKAVGIGCLVVVDEHGPVGILTERDIVQKVVADGRKPDETKVGDIMTTDLVMLKKENTVEEAVDLMERKHIKKIPITEDGHVVGIVTMTDLLKTLRRLEEEYEKDGQKKRK